MKRLLLLFVLLTSPLYANQELAVDVSTREIEIRSNFDGSNILIFGTFEQKEEEEETPSLAIVVEGPSENLTIWRKSPVLGMWFNTSMHKFKNVPSYYAAISSTPLSTIWDRSYLAQNNIGLSFLDIGELSTQSSWRQALMEIKQNSKLYREDQSGISFLKKKLFRVDVALPSTAKPGLYKVTAYHFIDGRFSQSDVQELNIKRVGSGAYLAKMAQEKPAVYGLLAILMALVTGYLSKIILTRNR